MATKKHFTYSRSELFEKCILGRGIGPQRSHSSLPPGPCESCGAGPLHGPREAPGGCPCSFYRRKHRLCRLCAAIYDLSVDGRTGIRNPGIDVVVIQHIVEVEKSLSGLGLFRKVVRSQ